MTRPSCGTDLPTVRWPRRHPRQGWRRRGRCRDGGGFTLVELLIALALGGVLIAVVATAFTFGIQTWSRSQEMVIDAGRTQLVTSRFLGDGLSAEQTRAAQACGSEGVGFVRGFTWNIGQDDDLSEAVYADWYLEEVADGDATVTVLVRRLCGSASGGPDVLLVAVDVVAADCTATQCSLEWSLVNGSEGELEVGRRVDPS